jgi:hypothetical protein
MDWPVTAALAGAFTLFAIFCGWRGARLPDPVRGPRLVPWRFLMILAVFALVLLVVHMVNLAGVVTGDGARKPGG